MADASHVEARDVAALEHDATRGGRKLAGQHLEERGLAGAIRADNAAQFAMLDGEVDVAVGDEAAEALGQALGLQDQVTRACGRRGAATV